MTCRHRKNMPLIWLMTDERIGEAALLAAVAQLPRGRAGIIFRHYRTAPGARWALFEAARAIARRRRLMLLLAGTGATYAGQADRCGTARPRMTRGRWQRRGGAGRTWCCCRPYFRHARIRVGRVWGG